MASSSRCFLLKSLKNLQSGGQHVIRGSLCKDLSRRNFDKPRYFSSNTSPEAVTSQKEKWDLLGAVCLERRPVITQELNDFEKKINEYIMKLEHENSMISDHELRYREDAVYTQRSKNDELTLAELENPREMAVEAEDKWEAELKSFELASRKTVADEKDDRKSTDRKLDTKLILIVKYKIGENDVWMLPHSQWIDGESMRQTATRALNTQCGNNIKSFFMGNAPCGFYKYKYPNKLNKDSVGTKIFFFKALYNEGSVNLNSSEIKDYLWVTKSELVDYLPPAYLQSVNKFIVDL